jgi:hypothetical protein
MYIGFDIKYPLFLSDFNKAWIFQKVFEKIWNIKFYENMSARSQVVPCERADRRTR